MTNVDDPSRPEGHPLIEDLVAFVDGDLDGAEIEIVAAHLARCASCSDLVREIEPIGLKSTTLRTVGRSTPVERS